MPIRLFTPNDYAAIAEINNVFWTEEMLTAEQWQHEDAQRPTHCQHARWVAELDDQVIGMCEYDQLPSRYHPAKYWLRLEVLPAKQRRGVGAMLYDTLMTALAPCNPWLVRFALTENLTDSLRFLRARGFAEEWRSYESHWDVTQFDPALFKGIEEKLGARGIVIKTYAELANDSKRDPKLYELFEDTRADTAFIEPLTRNDYSRWRDMFLDGFRANREAFWVAVCGDEYVGVAILANAARGATIDTRWVGVRRDQRGQGIAMGFKKRMSEYARAHNHPRILTVTNSLNAPVIAMNKQLGYVDQPAWVYYSKNLRKEKP